MKRIIIITIVVSISLMMDYGCSQSGEKPQIPAKGVKNENELIYLKDVLLQTALDVYPDILKIFKEDGSTIRSDGYTIYQQYTGFYFAFLYSYEHPGNPWHGNASMLELAVRAWEQFATRVNEKGETHIITMNQDWGYSLDEWGFYYWLSTYDLIKDKLPDGGARWLEYLQRIYGKLSEHVRNTAASEGFARSLGRHQASNHFVWTVLGMYRYGQLMNDADAMDFAAKVMGRIFDAQLPIGTWLENGGLVISYAEVTNCPISIYAIYSGDERAARCIERCLAYQNALKNPDFTKVLGIDERNRFSRGVNTYTAPSFAFSESGVAYLSRWIHNITATRQLANNTQSLTVFCEILRLLPDVEYFAKTPTPAPLNTSFPEQYLFVRETGPWILSFCGMKHEAYNSRWSLERQGLLGIYLNGKGPLMGGAHSIGQPEFSIFNVITGGKLYYMHDSCMIDNDKITLLYGGRQCTIQVLETGEQQIRLRFSVDGLREVDRAFVHMPLYYLNGSSITIDGVQCSFAEEYITSWIEADATFSLHGVDCAANAGSTLRYPVFPFNSYMQKQERSFADVYGIWSIELDYKQPSADLMLTIAR